MADILYILKQLMLVAGFGLSAFAVGKVLVGRYFRLTPLEELALLTPAGIGFFILILFALGLLRILVPIVVIPVLGTLSCCALLLLRPVRYGQKFVAAMRSVGAVSWMWILLAGVLLLLILLVPLIPPIDSDEIRYHLPYARHFLQEGGLSPQLALRYPFYALNIDLLYTFALMLGDDVTPHYVHLLLGLLVALNLFVLARSLTNSLTAFLAVFLFLGLTPVLRLAASAYIDLGLACFTFSAFVCLSLAREKYHDSCTGSHALLAAFLLGIAIGAKYLGWLYLPILTCWCWYCIRKWRSALAFMSIALVTGLPWYLYNFYHSGNPVSPFAGQYFGYWPWSEEDAQNQLAELASLGSGHSLSSFLALPISLMEDHWLFQSPELPWLLMMMFPAYLFLPFWERKLLPYGIFFAVILVLWFMGAQVLRYLISFLPLWCLFSVWAADRSLRYCCGLLETGISSRGWAVPNMTGTLVPILLLLAVLQLYRNDDYLVYPREVSYYVSGREAFLHEAIPEYGAIIHINGMHSGKKILQLETGAAYSYINSNEVIGDWFGLFRYAAFVNAFDVSLAQGLAFLRESEIELVLLSKELLASQPGWRAALDSTLAAEYEDAYSIVFSVPVK